MRRGWRALCMLGCLLIVLGGCADGARHNAAGNDLYTESAYNEALNEYQLAQVAEPDRAEPYYNAANAHNRLSQPEEALAQTEQALKTAEPALAAQAWYNLGNAFFDAEQWAAAAEAYKEALRNAPADMDAKHNLELALQKLEEEQQQEDQSQSSDEQNEGDEQQNEDQESQEDGQEQQSEEQGEEGAPTPTPSDQEQDSSSGDDSGEEPPTPQPGGENEPAEGMTEEQAIQLLRAVLGDSETLQERLQELVMPAQGATGEDW